MLAAYKQNPRIIKFPFYTIKVAVGPHQRLL